MKISRLVNNLPKRLFASALLGLAVFLPVATSAASTVKIEGSMGVANVTRGDTKYVHSVNATYNQVVKLQVYYHNRELPNSGKVAQNLRVKINIPSKPGKTQTQTATISADNSNTVTSSTTVNLDQSNAFLQYIPGSALWRHNVGTNSNIKEVNTKISDDVVTSGTGLRLENEKPCYNFSATVTVLARVMVPGTKVVKQVEKANQTGKWAISNTANPGDTLKYMITYTNTGNTTAKNVVVRDNLPPNLTYVPNSTIITNSSHPQGIKSQSDVVTTDGIIIGDYAPGAVAYVTLEAKIAPASKLACGTTKFTNVGIAHPKTLPEYYNTAYTTVKKTCTPPPKTPVFTCNLLTLSQDKTDRRKVTAHVTFTAKNGATFKTATFDFNDGSKSVITTTNTTRSYTYTSDGTKTVSARLLFSVNGQDKFAPENAACTQQLTIKPPKTPTPPTTPTTPTQLPNTGAGNTIGLFAGAVVAGMIGYRLFLSRKLARR